MRVRTGTVRHKRHKRLLKQARGFYSGRRKHFRKAKEQLERSLVYAYRDRRQKKRDFRRLWIVRINAAARLNEMNYSSAKVYIFLSELPVTRLSLPFLLMSEIAKGTLPNRGNTS